jgi:glycosyltransferase involved in cell wall biosynthesis
LKKVSVIIPLYNSEPTLIRCIDSVLDQDYGNVEVVVVDDGSDDRSLEVAQTYSSKNVLVFSQENKGACAARNFGINRSTGYYLKFLDSDDFLEPNTLAREVLVAEACGPQFIPYGFNKVLNDDKFYVKKSKVGADHQSVDLINSNLTITLPLHRKSVIDDIGRFDESLQFRQEWDLHLRLVDAGYKFHYHNFCVFTQYIHNSSCRISSRALLFNKEISNLDNIRKKFNFSSDSTVAAAWSYKYWMLARQFLKDSNIEEANLIFEMAKEIAPKYYKRMMPTYYRYAVSVLGTKKAEELVNIYKKIMRLRHGFIG